MCADRQPPAAFRKECVSLCTSQKTSELLKEEPWPQLMADNRVTLAIYDCCVCALRPLFVLVQTGRLIVRIMCIGAGDGLLRAARHQVTWQGMVEGVSMRETQSSQAWRHVSFWVHLRVTRC